MKTSNLKKIIKEHINQLNEQQDNRACLQAQTVNPEVYAMCIGHCGSTFPQICSTIGFTEECCSSGEARYTCDACKGCERKEDGEFASEEECEATGCFSGTLNDYAISLGLTDGVPGVQGTIMSAEDQYCIKCQAGSWSGDMAIRCVCCSTQYTYDDNTITYGSNNTNTGVGPIDPGKAPLSSKKTTAPNRLSKLAFYNKNKK